METEDPLFSAFSTDTFNNLCFVTHADSSLG